MRPQLHAKRLDVADLAHLPTMYHHHCINVTQHILLDTTVFFPQHTKLPTYTVVFYSMVVLPMKVFMRCEIYRVVQLCIVQYSIATVRVFIE